MTFAGWASAGVFAAAPAIEVTSIWDFVVKGGIVMVPIGLCSLVTIAVAVERAVTLRRSAVLPAPLVAALRGGDERASAAACAAHPSPLARLATAALRKRSAGSEAVAKAIDDAEEREFLGLRKRLRAFTLVVALAPLLGLLGTIFGMIKAFQTVALSAEALGRTELLAGGIYEAMVTTAAGLVVAIPALLLYHWFAAATERRLLEMDGLVREFAEVDGIAAGTTEPAFADVAAAA